MTYHAMLKRIRAVATADKVRVMCYLLGRLALEPAPGEQAQLRTLLAGGTVLLRFFGVSNPLPLFEVPVGSPEHRELQHAVELNMGSAMMAAARRVRRWHAPQNTHRRYQQEDAVLRRLEQQLAWPNADDWHARPDEAREAHGVLLSQLQLKRDVVRERRNARLRLIGSAATPGLTSATELLKDILDNVLAPATTH